MSEIPITHPDSKVVRSFVRSRRLVMLSVSQLLDSTSGRGTSCVWVDPRRDRIISGHYEIVHGYEGCTWLIINQSLHAC